VRTRSNKRVVICVLAACMTMMGGCEVDNAGTPQVIPGPSVPSPVPLHAPYLWDTPEELKVWTDNAVSRGSFSIDSNDSNGAITIQLTGSSGGPLLLRGPDIDPPAKAIRALRIRYRWLTELPVSFYPSLWVAVEATNAPSADVQPRNFKSLQAGPDWKELEVGSFLNSASAPLDVRYAYVWVAPLPVGLLKIDAIMLVN
jgi:hypothetical protein